MTSVNNFIQPYFIVVDPIGIFMADHVTAVGGIDVRQSINSGSCTAIQLGPEIKRCIHTFPWAPAIIKNFVCTFPPCYVIISPMDFKYGQRIYRDTRIINPSHHAASHWCNCTKYLRSFTRQ